MDLFTYGTLMAPAIMESVTGNRYRGMPGRLRDHARFRLKGKTYPGMIPLPGANTDGFVYAGIDADAFRRLDAFEGEMYQRTTVTVILPDQAAVPAESYLLRPGYSSLLTDEPWDFEDFKIHSQQRFIRTYVGFESIDP